MTVLHDFFVWVFSGLVENLTLAYLAFADWAVGFAWDVAKQIIEDLDVNSKIVEAWEVLPDNVTSVLKLLHFTEFLDIIMSSYVTRYVLRFIPFI